MSESVPVARPSRSTAIVHEWVTARAGSELCFERMAGLYPDADLFALSRKPGVHIETQGRAIQTSNLDRVARTPLGRAITLPLMARAYRSIKHPSYDLVVSSSHAFSRAFAHSAELHLSYTYTPARYLWYPEIDRRGGAFVAPSLRNRLRRQDLELSMNVDSFAAISSVVAERIGECYGREAQVIYPACDTRFFSPGGTRSDDPTEPFLLSIGRFIPYKRHDLAIRIGERIGVRVVVAGSGPEAERLKGLAGASSVPVDVVESPSRETVRDLYRSAAATIFAPIEDFGIVPVESMACGTPVVAVGVGGALDTVGTEGGCLSPTQEINDLVVAAETVLASPPDRHGLVERASTFSSEMFDRRFRQWVNNESA